MYIMVGNMENRSEIPHLNWFQSVTNLIQLALMPRLHLPRASYDLFAYYFLYDISGIAGG